MKKSHKKTKSSNLETVGKKKEKIFLFSTLLKNISQKQHHMETKRGVFDVLPKHRNNHVKIQNRMRAPGFLQKLKSLAFKRSRVLNIVREHFKKEIVNMLGRNTEAYKSNKKRLYD